MCVCSPVQTGSPPLEQGLFRTSAADTELMTRGAFTNRSFSAVSEQTREVCFQWNNRRRENMIVSRLHIITTSFIRSVSGCLVSRGRVFEVATTDELVSDLAPYWFEPELAVHSRAIVFRSYLLLIPHSVDRVLFLHD